MKAILAIDPSIRACGVALRVEYNHVYQATLRPPMVGTDLERCWVLVGKLEEWLKPYCNIGEDMHIIIETPTFQDSTKGILAAKQGYTLKIAKVVGYIMGWASEKYPDATSEEVTPTQWKGMLTKDQTRERILADPAFKVIYPKTFDHNASDAMGIMQWYFSTLQKWVPRGQRPFIDV